MKYWRFIIIGLAFVFLLYYYFAVYKDARQHDANVQSGQEQVPNPKQWDTKTDEQSLVLIKVTPLQLGPSQNQWKFEVTFTTHAGDLDFEPTTVTTLVNDAGESFNPTSWEGPGAGGHHISGNLVFNAIPNTKLVELKIKNVGGIAERSFKWSLE